MPLFYRFTRISAGWRFAYPAYKTIYLSEGYSTPQARQAPRRRARTAGVEPLVCRVALRLPGLQRHIPIRRLLNTPDPASAAGLGQRARSRLCAGWRVAYPAYKVIYLSEGYSTPQTRQAPPGKDSGRGAACVPGGASLTRPTTPFTSQKATHHPRPGTRRRARPAGVEPLVCRGALRLPGRQRHLPLRRLLTTPDPARAAGQGQRAWSRLCAGGRFAYPADNAIYLSEGYSTPQTRQAPPGKDSRRGAACVPGGASLTRPTKSSTYQKVTQHPRSGKRRRARQAGAEPRLCRVALRLPGLHRHLPLRRLLPTPDPARAAPPGKDSGRGAASVPGGASLTRPTTPFTYQKVTQHPRSGKRRRARKAGAEPLLCRVALRLPGLQRHVPLRRLLNTPDPASAAPPGKDSGRGAASVPGGASRTRPTTPFTNQKATQHPRPGKRRAAGQGQRARSRFCAGWRFAYPAYNAIYLSEGCSTPQTRQAPRRPASAAGAEPLVCRVAATPYPAWSSCDLSLIYSPALLKLPVLAASKSLRRSRKAGAARMDAG